jgi:SNF2 family DNA or RNA helicase
MLLKRFPNTPYFGSGINQRQKYFLEKRWNEGKIPVLFAQIGATALGLNLQEAGYNVAYYHITWDYLHYDQFIKRVARQGQKAKRVIVHRLIASNTIDDQVTIPKLTNRQMTQDDFLAAMRRHTMDSV